MDFEFSPFDDHLLLSASEDLTMKLWQIPSDGLTQHLKDNLLQGRALGTASFPQMFMARMALEKKHVLNDPDAWCLCLEEPLLTLEGHGKKVPSLICKTLFCTDAFDVTTRSGGLGPCIAHRAKCAKQKPKP